MLLHFVLEAKGDSGSFVISANIWHKRHVVQYWTEIESVADLIYLFLTARDDNMPHCSFDYIEGAGVTFLDIVLLTEPPPTMHKKVALFVAWDTTHPPRPSHCGLERDHGRLMKSDRITESYWQSLQFAIILVLVCGWWLTKYHITIVGKCSLLDLNSILLGSLHHQMRIRNRYYTRQILNHIHIQYSNIMFRLFLLACTYIINC